MAITDYKEIYSATQNNTEVFIDKGAECRLGTMTYKTDLAAADNYSITRHFAAVVCDLPVTYNATVYANFFDQWGTVIYAFSHIVYDVKKSNLPWRISTDLTTRSIIQYYLCARLIRLDNIQ